MWIGNDIYSVFFRTLDKNKSLIAKSLNELLQLSYHFLSEDYKSD